MLGQIVTSSGEKCVGSEAFFMGMYKNEHSAFWSVRCTNGASYAVSIEANATGSTKVLDCRLLRSVAGVSCFTKFNEQ